MEHASQLLSPPVQQRRVRAGARHRRGRSCGTSTSCACRHPQILAVWCPGPGSSPTACSRWRRDLTQDQLQECANYLNADFGGLSLAAIRERLLELMREEKALYDSLLQKVVAVGSRAFAGGGRRGDRVPGRRVEHARPAGVRGPRAHARPLQDVRGEGPPGADPERVPLGRAARVHRPRGARPRPARPVARDHQLSGGRREGLGPRRAGLDAHGVRARGLASSTTWRARWSRRASRRCTGDAQRRRRERTRPAETASPRARGASRRGRGRGRGAAARGGATSRTSCCGAAPSSRTTRSAPSATAQQAQAGGDGRGALGPRARPSTTWSARSRSTPATRRALREGVELIRRELTGAARGAATSPSRIRTGQPFDPERHQALSHEHVPGFDGGHGGRGLPQGLHAARTGCCGPHWSRSPRRPTTATAHRRREGTLRRLPVNPR